MGGIFEGFGMNEEGRRSLSEEERPNVYRRRVSWNCTSTSLSTPHVSLSPFPATVPVIVSWHWTRPHASFGFRFTSCEGPIDVVISFELSVPCSSARPTSSVLGTTYQLYPSNQILLPLSLSPFLKKVSSPHVPCSRVETIPLSLSNPGMRPCFECFRHTDPERSQA
jgi:hypothetical protein